MTFNRNVSYLSLIGLLLLILLGWCLFLPRMLALPQNLDVTYVFDGEDNFYDPEAKIYTGGVETYSALFFIGTSTSGGPLVVAQAFEVGTDPENLFFATAEEYTIDRVGYTHLEDGSERQYLFGPIMRGLVKHLPDKAPFFYKQANYPTPVRVTFFSEEIIGGVPVYKYISSFENDQTAAQTGQIPGVGEELGVRVEVDLELWIEPYTGRMVRYFDRGTTYLYDLETGENVEPRNTYKNTLNQDSEDQIIDIVSELKQEYIVYQYVVPGVFLFFVLFLTLMWLFTRYSIEKDLRTKGLFRVRRFLLPFFVLCFGVAASILISYLIYTFIQNDILRSFQDEAREIQEDVDSRIKIYTSVLRGTKGFVDASNEVSRDEWRTYVESLNIQEQFPGIQGIGMSVFVTPEERTRHIQDIRSEGFPEYTIKPAGERDIYTAIIYLEPFDERNRQAFGFDMFQEANRNAAMSYARDNDGPGLSGKVTLVQEITDDVQAGFLLYVPFYEKDVAIDTRDARRDNIVGYVYSPFRMGDFMSNILPEGSDIVLRIYDANKSSIDEELLMYSSDQELVDPGNTILVEEYDFGGRVWSMVYERKSGYGVTFITSILPWVSLIIGLVITSFMLLIVVSLGSRQEKVLALARGMTQNLREKTEELNEKVIEFEVEKNKLTTVISSMAEGVIVLDPDGVVILSNITAEEMLGSHLVGKKFVDHIELYDASENKIEREKRLVERAAKTPESIVRNLRDKYFYKKPTGEMFPVAIFTSAMVVDGEFQGVIQVFRDITKDLEIDQAKTDFVSLASHQLRTPLTATRWYTDLLSEDNDNLTNDQKEYILEIRKGSERMIQMVNALLNVSRIELGTFGVTVEEVSLIEILETVQKELEPSITAKQQTVVTDVVGAPEAYKGDESLLKMILQNLLSNAVKYTPEEGAIRAKIATDDAHVVITISDTGYGIPESQQDSIFKKMFRADNIKSLDTDGTGLGLYIIKAIVDQVGGSISFTSEMNRGTTFIVKLPLSGMKEKKGSKALNA